MHRALSGVTSHWGNTSVNIVWEKSLPFIMVSVGETKCILGRNWLSSFYLFALNRNEFQEIRNVHIIRKLSYCKLLVMKNNVLMILIRPFFFTKGEHFIIIVYLWRSGISYQSSLKVIKRKKIPWKVPFLIYNVWNSYLLINIIIMFEVTKFWFLWNVCIVVK